jgi:hypothetical protein
VDINHVVFRTEGDFPRKTPFSNDTSIDEEAFVCRDLIDAEFWIAKVHEVCEVRPGMERYHGFRVSSDDLFAQRSDTATKIVGRAKIDEGEEPFDKSIFKDANVGSHMLSPFSYKIKKRNALSQHIPLLSMHIRFRHSPLWQHLPSSLHIFC